MKNIWVVLFAMLLFANFAAASGEKIMVVGNDGSFSNVLTDYQVTYKNGVSDYTTLQFVNYNLVIFNEYHQLTQSEEVAIQNYLNSGKPIILTSGVPACFAQMYNEDSCTYSLTNGVDISPWFGATSYTNSGYKANIVENNPFDSGLINGSIVHTNTGSGSGAVPTSALSSSAHIVAKWEDGDVFAFYYGKAYYQSEIVNAADHNTSILFKAAVKWLLDSAVAKLPYKILVLGPQGNLDSLLPEYQITYISGSADYSILNFSNYDIAIFEEYRQINLNENQVILNYFNSGKPMITMGSVPSCFVQAAGCPYNAPTVNLTSGVDISPWFGAKELTHGSGTAYLSEGDAFGSGLANSSRLAVGSGYGYSHITASSLLPNAHIIGIWQDGSVFAFYYGGAYYQSDVDNGYEPNSKTLFKSALKWLLEGGRGSLPSNDNDQNSPQGTSREDFRKINVIVQWSYGGVVDGAYVEIFDKDNQKVATGFANKNGVFATTVSIGTFLNEGDPTTYQYLSHTPHTIVAKYGYNSARATVNIDQNEEVYLPMAVGPLGGASSCTSDNTQIIYVGHLFSNGVLKLKLQNGAGKTIHIADNGVTVGGYYFDINASGGDSNPSSIQSDQEFDITGVIGPTSGTYFGKIIIIYSIENGVTHVATLTCGGVDAAQYQETNTGQPQTSGAEDYKKIQVIVHWNNGVLLKYAYVRIFDKDWQKVAGGNTDDDGSFVANVSSSNTPHTIIVDLRNVNGYTSAETTVTVTQDRVVDIDMGVHYYPLEVNLKEGWNLVPFSNPSNAFLDSFDATKNTCKEGLLAGWTYSPNLKKYLELDLMTFNFESLNDGSLFTTTYGTVYSYAANDNAANGKRYSPVFGGMWLYSNRNCKLEYNLELSHLPTLPTSENTFELSERSMPTLLERWNFLAVLPWMKNKSWGEIKGNCEVEKAYTWNAETQKWEGPLPSNFFMPASMEGSVLVLKTKEMCKLLGNGGLMTPPTIPED